MQFWEVTKDTKLSELSNLVGSRNVDQVLHVNELPRVPNIGETYLSNAQSVIESITESVDWQRKSSVLNSFAGDSDVFETAALSGASAWKFISAKGSFPTCIKIPIGLVIPDSARVLGNKQGVSANVYNRTMNSLSEVPHSVDPNIFNEYSSIVPSRFSDYTRPDAKVFEFFKIPWGDISLYSSLDNEHVDFPVYPESVSDARKANYTEMPELLYQYEPWQLYQSSGPRTNSYVFDFHRDMWNGDHNRGGANRLIRFCQAQCYPRYVGAAVNTAIVTLYVKGKILISGIMNDVSVDWDGPLGHDGWYLHCKLTLSITEVAPQALSHDTVMQMGVIG